MAGYTPNLVAQTPWDRNTQLFNNTSDSQRQWQNNRQLAQYGGDQWEGQQAGAAGQYGGAEAGYGNAVSDAYQEIWGGGGGYNPEQMGNVTQRGLTDQGLAGLDQNFLTSGEQAGASGNPYAAYNSSQGYQANIQAAAQGAGQRQQDYLPFLQGAQDAAAQTQRNELGRAIDPSQLGMSGAYGQSVGSALGGAQSAINNPGLQVTPEYLKEAHVSDQQVNDLASAGMRTAAAPYQADRSTLYRNASASGTVNPMAVGAMALQFDRAGAASAADAGNQARLQALAAQRGAAQNIQDTQLGAAGQQAGFGLNYGNMAIGAAGDLERTRLGAQQDISNRQIGAAQQNAQTSLDNSRGLATQGINVAGQAGDRNVAAMQYNANLGTGLQQTAEQQAADRAYALGQNRQGVQSSNNNTRLQTASDLSNRYTSAYSPYLSQQAEGRAALTGERNYYGSRTQDTQQLRLAGNQLQQQGVQGASTGYSNQVGIDMQPGHIAQGFNTAAKFVSIKPPG